MPQIWILFNPSLSVIMNKIETGQKMASKLKSHLDLKQEEED